MTVLPHPKAPGIAQVPVTSTFSHVGSQLSENSNREQNDKETIICIC